MTRAVLRVCVLSLVASSASAQSFPVQVRQNVNVKKDIAKPAFLMITFPDEKPAIYQVGVGLLANIPTGKQSPLLTLSGLLDYQRNTAVSSQQDVLKAGFSGEWQMRAVDFVRRNNSGVVSFRTNFKTDRVKDTRGVQEALYYTHAFFGRGRAPLPNRPWRPANNLFEIEYSPNVGLELDHVLDAANNGVTGTAARLLAQTNVALRPAPVDWDLRVELLVGGAYRYTANTTDIDSKRSHPLFTFEANYIPARTPHAEVALGATYVRGDDPDAGLEHQRYWQLAVKLRVK